MSGMNIAIAATNSVMACPRWDFICEVRMWYSWCGLVRLPVRRSRRRHVQAGMADQRIQRRRQGRIRCGEARLPVGVVEAGVLMHAVGSGQTAPGHVGLVIQV